MARMLPRGAVNAGAEALEAALAAGNLPPDTARIVLEAALPFIERHVRRQVAREILALDRMDREQVSITRNCGPFYDMQTSLRRLSRGEALPVPTGTKRLTGESDGGTDG